MVLIPENTETTSAWNTTQMLLAPSPLWGRVGVGAAIV